jgi:hypothetical protein
VPRRGLVPVAAPRNAQEPAAVALGVRVPAAVPVNAHAPVVTPLGVVEPAAAPVNAHPPDAVPARGATAGLVPVAAPANTHVPVAVPAAGRRPVAVPVKVHAPVAVPVRGATVGLVPVAVPAKVHDPVAVPARGATAGRVPVAVPVNAQPPVAAPVFAGGGPPPVAVLISTPTSKWVLAVVQVPVIAVGSGSAVAVSVHNVSGGTVCATLTPRAQPDPGVGGVALTPPIAAYSRLPAVGVAGNATETEVVLAGLALTVCTTAPAPLVPDVSTPVNCSTVQMIDPTTSARLIVSDPAVGEAPSARKTWVLREPVVTSVRSASSHVRPQPATPVTTGATPVAPTLPTTTVHNSSALPAG